MEFNSDGEYRMKKRYLSGILTIIAALTLCACGPSDEKIIEAQGKYRELITIHNEVVNAHSAIKDASLDDELLALEESIPLMEEYNLNDMTDDEINILIDSMNNVISSYTTYLTTIGEIKQKEDASMLTPVYLTIVNMTDITFTKLSLEEKGEINTVTDALETLSGFGPNQEIIGLTIYKDVDNTPWILHLDDKDVGEVNENAKTDEEEKESENSANEEAGDETNTEETSDSAMTYEFEIDVSKYTSEKGTVTIRTDEETGELYIE